MPTNRRVIVATTVSAHDGLTEYGTFCWWPEREADRAWALHARTRTTAVAVLKDFGGDALRARVLWVNLPDGVDPETEGEIVTAYLEDIVTVDTYDCELPALATFDYHGEPYRTLTAVVRSDEREDVMRALEYIDGVQFAATAAGVSAEALRLGASPADWEDSEDCDEGCAVHLDGCDGMCDHVGHRNACFTGRITAPETRRVADLTGAQLLAAASDAFSAEHVNGLHHGQDRDSGCPACQVEHEDAALPSTTEH